MSSQTPNLGLPYPELTDTADVPRDVKALADKLDALLGGGGGGGGGGVLPLAAAPVLAVGVPGQIRAGRQLAGADFTSLGLSAPIGLWNLSDLTNLGSDARPLVNLGAVPFAVGINGLATTCAQFAGSSGQALYIADSGAADPYRLKTGSAGCWFRTAKRGVAGQSLLTKWPNVAGQQAWLLQVNSSNVVAWILSGSGTDALTTAGVSDVADDRWHFVVGTADGTQGRLYVDGVLEAVGSAPGLIAGGNAPLNIGANAADASTAASAPHYGRIDEAFVTGDVLTEDQVRLLYATKLGHALGALPSAARLNIHRRRKGPALAVADFTTQPIRLHNFTGGALTDQGSGGVALTNNGSAVPVAGADGTPGSAFNFVTASNQSLSATDAGLPGGLTPRSFGCWFKTGVFSAWQHMIAYGATGDSTDTKVSVYSGTGVLRATNGADQILGPFVADGQWHFVVVTEDNVAGDGVKRKLWLDGRLVGGSTVMNPITLGGANKLRIGSSVTPDQSFTGQIDAVFVCGYALGQAEILSLYAKGIEDLGRSPKNAGDHVERMDATTLLFIGDTLESQWTVDLGVVA